jgi:nitroreductase
MNNVKTIIRGRRSCRAFTDEPMSRDRINELINDAVWAPTGSNNQPWRFVVITDSLLMKKYSDAAKNDWLKMLGETPHMQQYVEYIRDPDYNIFYNAPVLVIVYGNTESYWRVYDCTMVAYNLMLLAEEAGLGSCWIGFAHNIFAAKEIKKELGIPENCELVAPVILGHPAKSEAASAVPRKPFSIKFHDSKTQDR